MSNILIYQTPNGKTKLEVTLEDETLWLNQKQLCELFDKSKSTICEHLNAIFDDEELDRRATVRNFRTVQNEGEREIERDIEYYNLDVVIALGFKGRSRKRFVMDDERLKNPPVANSKAPDYFDELLECILEARIHSRIRY